MGIFSNNRYVGPTIEVGINENYDSTTACVQAMIENEQNNQIFFEQLIGLDFAEAQSVREGAEMEVVNEGAISDFFAKVKEVWKKVCEKIKGVFAAFVARLRGVVARDNKKFMEKYKSEVLKKDLSKLKFKWSKPKNLDAALDAGKSISDTEDNIQKSINSVLSLTSAKAIDEESERIDDGDEFENYSDKLISVKASQKEFPKEFHEYLFEDVEEEEGLSSDILNEIIKVLGDNKYISTFQKQMKNVDKLYSSVLKKLDKLSTEIAKDVPNFGKDGGNHIRTKDIQISDTKKSNAFSYSDGSKGAGLEMKKAVLCSKKLSVGQKFAAMVTNETIKGAKFHIAQCRKVFAKAAAFNPKSVKESAVFAEAFGSAEAYDVLALMD